MKKKEILNLTSRIRFKKEGIQTAETLHYAQTGNKIMTGMRPQGFVLVFNGSAGNCRFIKRRTAVRHDLL